jgi:hypothetical protein
MFNIGGQNCRKGSGNIGVIGIIGGISVIGIIDGMGSKEYGWYRSMDGIGIILFIVIARTCIRELF